MEELNMAKLTKQSFQYFKGISELRCGWTVEDDYYEEVIQPQLDLMRGAMYRAEFMFKCLYPNERPLSKEDYKRTRYAHRNISNKYHSLSQVQKKSVDDAFQRNIRKMKICKGIYPFGLSFEEAIKDEEIKRYYEKGLYKEGSFVHKFIAPIHKF